MPKLKIAAIPDDKPVKVTSELPATVHQNLLAYAKALADQSGKKVDPIKLIPAMLERFMATDRGFAKLRRTLYSTSDRDGGVG
jgi:hypothetical protein